MALILDGTNGLSDVDGSAATPAIRGTDTNTGIFFPAADTIAFSEGGTEVARFDASGNLGIGTTTPFSKLDVAGQLDVSTVLASGFGLRVRSPSGSATPAVIQFTNNPVTAQWATIASPSSDVITFNNSGGTERMRLNADGNLRVKSASAGTEIFNVEQSTIGGWTEILSNSTASGQGLGHLVQFTARAPNDTTSLFYYAGDSVQARFFVYANGGIANYQANDANLSDRREKTNFSPAPSYLEKICAIPVQTFNYVDQNLEKDDGLTLGVIAQDVQAVAPELVMESNWAGKDEPEKMRLSIYQTDLQYALMKSIQELKATVDAQAAQIAALEAAE
jgi:hypothetical protein